MSSLELRDFEVFAGRRPVAGPLSLLHGNGRILWLVGENGAGKSSLLRALAGRARFRGKMLPNPVPLHLRDVAYYAPVMTFPPGVRVRDWLLLHEQQPSSAEFSADQLLPKLKPSAALSRLSSGEGKRCQLWALLRLDRHFYFLDEPYEHLSPSAKATLTNLLLRIADKNVVVVATNQDIPPNSNAQVVEVGS